MDIACGDTNIQDYRLGHACSLLEMALKAKVAQ